MFSLCFSLCSENSYVFTMLMQPCISMATPPSSLCNPVIFTLIVSFFVKDVILRLFFLSPREFDDNITLPQQLLHVWRLELGVETANSSLFNE